MSTMVPMYGFGGGGGKGASLTVNAPSGCTVTVSKDGKTKTKTAGADGVAVFKGLETGEWTITITDGEQTAQKPVTVTADYAAEITFFAATINVTYPAGSVCTATDGTTTLTAPDTSGTWECVVPNTGTWTVSLNSGFSETVTISDNGETKSIKRWYLYCNGDERTSVTGGWQSRAWKRSSNYTAVTPTVTKNTDNMILKIGATAKYRSGCVETKNDIDLTGFSTLYFDRDTLDGSENYGFGSLDVCDRNATYFYDSCAVELSFEMQASRETQTADISAISGRYDILVAPRVTTMTASGKTAAIKVYNVWLEV